MFVFKWCMSQQHKTVMRRQNFCEFGIVLEMMDYVDNWSFVEDNNVVAYLVGDPNNLGLHTAISYLLLILMCVLYILYANY